jgi:branched-chain amino acid aminotransferase
MVAKINGLKKGYFEPLFTDLNGFIAEGATSNVFLVKKGALCTPPASAPILPGVTRGAVIKIARKAGIKIKEANIRRADLGTFSEVFITNSSVEIMPVKEIKGHFSANVKNYRIYPILSSLYGEYVSGSVK